MTLAIGHVFGLTLIVAAGVYALLTPTNWQLPATLAASGIVIEIGWTLWCEVEASKDLGRLEGRLREEIRAVGEASRQELTQLRARLEALERAPGRR